MKLKTLAYKICFRIKYILPDIIYLKILFWLNFGYKLNLKQPQTFSEKIQWLKLYNRKVEYTKMVDKYTAKEYVSQIIGKEYIIPTIGVWNKPEEIDWELLPKRFVLKTTHGGGSGGVIICSDKKTFDKKTAISKLNKSLKSDIYINYREWPYKNIKKKIIAEEYIEDTSIPNNDLKDYKFFCFNGEPKFCQVIGGRKSKMTIDFFDMKWKHQPFHEPKNYPFADIEPECPQQFQKMKELASKLSTHHPFLRVDFYEVNNQIKFGELTFYPTSGLGGFSPEIWDKKMGDLIKINTSKI